MQSVKIAHFMINYLNFTHLTKIWMSWQFQCHQKWQMVILVMTKKMMTNLYDIYSACYILVATYPTSSSHPPDDVEDDYRLNFFTL